MKILIVSQYFYPERFSINDIAKELVKQGNDVHVLTGKPNYGYEKIVPGYEKIKYEEWEGIKIHRVNLLPRKKSRLSIINNYLSFWWNSSKFVNKLDDDFDVVLSVSLSPVIAINAANKYAKKHNVKHVLYCLDLWPESTVVTGAVKKNSLMYKILYKWSKKMYEGCDKIIVSSPSFVSYFNEVLGIKNKQFEFVPQPGMMPKIDLPAIKYDNKYNIVYAGNIGTIQLVDRFVLATKNINEDFKLHLIGMGSLDKKVNDIIKDNHLEDKVIYHGPKQIEETVRYYKNADALIVGLDNKGTVGKTIPNKLSQYLYFNKPILGVLEGDGKDLLTKTGGALLTANDVDSISKGMLDIIYLDEKTKIKMGKKNKDYYEKNLTIQEITRSILNHLK